MEQAHGHNIATAGGGHHPALLCGRQSQIDLPEMLARSTEQEGSVFVRDGQRERRCLELPSLWVEGGIRC